METKTCSECREVKPVEEFAKKRHLYRKRCKPCHQAWMCSRKWGFDTVAEYLSFIAGPCEICGRREKRGRGKTITRLVIDHDHDTMLVRGVLCSNCNMGIGLLENNPDYLQAAIDYLRRPPAHERRLSRQRSIRKDSA